jgi:hypothetical protein
MLSSVVVSDCSTRSKSRFSPGRYCSTRHLQNLDFHNSFDGGDLPLHKVAQLRKQVEDFKSEHTNEDNFDVDKQLDCFVEHVLYDNLFIALRKRHVDNIWTLALIIQGPLL